MPRTTRNGSGSFRHRRLQADERRLAFGHREKGDHLGALFVGRQVTRRSPQTLLAAHHILDMVARHRMEPAGQALRFAHVRDRAIREQQHVVQLVLRLFLVFQHTQSNRIDQPPEREHQTPERVPIAPAGQVKQLGVHVQDHGIPPFKGGSEAARRAPRAAWTPPESSKAWAPPQNGGDWNAA